MRCKNSWPELVCNLAWTNRCSRLECFTLERSTIDAEGEGKNSDAAAIFWDSDSARRAWLPSGDHIEEAWLRREFAPQTVLVVKVTISSRLDTTGATDGWMRVAAGHTMNTIHRLLFNTRAHVKFMFWFFVLCRGGAWRHRQGRQSQRRRQQL